MEITGNGYFSDLKNITIELIEKEQKYLPLTDDSNANYHIWRKTYISLIIMSATLLESYINKVGSLKLGYDLFRVNYENKDDKKNKKDLKSKIRLILPKKGNKNFSDNHFSEYDILCKLITARHLIIHDKSHYYFDTDKESIKKTVINEHNHDIYHDVKGVDIIKLLLTLNKYVKKTLNDKKYHLLLDVEESSLAKYSEDSI